jgi:hypothetical protein
MSYSQHEPMSAHIHTRVRREHKIHVDTSRHFVTFFFHVILFVRSYRFRVNSSTVTEH